LFVLSPCILIGLFDDETKVWRCYVIWGERKDIVVLPGALVAATTGRYFTPHLCACMDTPFYTEGVSVGYCVTLRNSGSFDTTSAVDPRVPFVIGVFTNLLLMALTGA
jgi:hypothetical protein